MALCGPEPLLRGLEVQAQDLCSGMKRKDEDARFTWASLGPLLNL